MVFRTLCYTAGGTLTGIIVHGLASTNQGYKKENSLFDTVVARCAGPSLEGFGRDGDGRLAVEGAARGGPPGVAAPGTQYGLSSTNPLASIASCRCVIIGGGHGGSKAAHLLDSLFDVTLIDEKNYNENFMDIIPIITKPWTELTKQEYEARRKNGDPWDSIVACQRAHALHRFYLKRANILTGTATGVTGNHVTLADGRRVPYDLLVLATGRSKSFPFRSTQRKLNGRREELKAFNQFLRDPERHRIAIVGGGPAGVALAAALAENTPDKEIVLFHSHSQLVPLLPGRVRDYCHQVLENMHSAAVVRGRLEGSDIEKGGGSVTIKLNSRVTNITASAATPMTDDYVSPVEAMARPVSSSSRLGWMLGLSTAQQGKPVKYEAPTKYTLTVDEYSTEHAPGASGRSILHRLYFGDIIPPTSQYAVQLGGAGEEDLTRRYIRLNDANAAMQKVNEENQRPVAQTAEYDNFDYVFNLTGGIPRPLPGDPQQQNTLLAPHILPDGRYRTSTLMQLLGSPNIFAVGSCNSFPWVNSVGNTELQVRTLFKNLNSVLASPAGHPRLLQGAVDGINPRRMLLPRLIVPLGDHNAAGCTAWAGAVYGQQALKDLQQDASHHRKEFRQPLFYKQHNQAVVVDRVAAWLAADITDVTDFTY